MSRPRGRTVPVLLATLVLVGAANVAAYAANGKPLLLGRDNSASKTTGVQNTGNGPALTLRSKPGAPPLAVSGTQKVAKLNADRVDGLEGSSLQTRAYRYQIPSSPDDTGIRQVAFPGLPGGRYDASYSILMFGTSPVRCWLGQSPARAFSISSNESGLHATNASALIDTRSAAAPLVCASGANFDFYSNVGDAVSEVVFTRVNTAVDRTPTVTRPTADRKGRVTGGR